MIAAPATPPCPECRTPLPPGFAGATGLEACPACGYRQLTRVFPALGRLLAPGPVAEPVRGEGEATCFFHPGQRAVVPCEGCGRFLCGLCDIDLAGRHVCAGCLSAGRGGPGPAVGLETRRVTHDTLSLALALVPVIVPCLFPFAVITAPLAVVLGIMGLRGKGSLPRTSRWRAVLGIVVGALSTLALGGLLVHGLTISD